MYRQNLKFVALPVPEIIVGIRINWAVPGYAHAPFSPKLLMGFCSDWPSLKSVAFPTPEKRVPKKFAQSLDMPTLTFLQNF